MSDKATLSDIAKAIAAFEAERDTLRQEVQQKLKRIEHCSVAVMVLLKAAQRMEE